STLSLNGMAVNARGDIFIADGVSQIYRVKPTGEAGVVAGTKLPGFFGGGGAASEGALAGPKGLVSAKGKIFVADSWNGKIRVLTPTSVGSDDLTISTLLGSSSSGKCSNDLDETFSPVGAGQTIRRLLTGFCFTSPDQISVSTCSPTSRTR